MLIWILLYLIVGVLFDHKVAKTVDESPSDPIVRFMIHLMIIMMWPLVMFLVLRTAVKIDTTPTIKESEEEKEKETKE